MMKTIATPCKLILAISIALGSNAVMAQQHDHSHGSAGATPSTPTANYAGQQDREIKALSAQEQQDWMDGKGSGLAKAAELNGYPGPMHTLEHAEALKLNAEQREKTQLLLKQHKERVRSLGAELVAQERSMDTLFATSRMTPDLLDALTARIALLQGEIRAEHLRTHLAQTALLSVAQVAQVAQYSALRGYTN